MPRVLREKSFDVREDEDEVDSRYLIYDYLKGGGYPGWDVEGMDDKCCILKNGKLNN